MSAPHVRTYLLLPAMPRILPRIARFFRLPLRPFRVRGDGAPQRSQFTLNDYRTCSFQFVLAFESAQESYAHRIARRNSELPDKETSISRQVKSGRQGGVRSTRERGLSLPARMRQVFDQGKTADIGI